MTTKTTTPKKRITINNVRDGVLTKKGVRDGATDLYYQRGTMWRICRGNICSTKK